MYTYCNICDKWIHQDAFYHLKASVVCRCCYLANKQAVLLALPAYAGLVESTVETAELCEKCFRYKPVSKMVDAGYYDNNTVIRACSDCITL